MGEQQRRVDRVGAVAFVVLAGILASCSGLGTSPGPSSSLGAVTPPPAPGTFGCPAQVLAGSPPTSRLVGVDVTTGSGFDRLTFAFAPGPPDKPAEASGLIVRPVGVVPKKDADGRPLSVLGERFIEVRFRDMALTDEVGRPAFVGPTDVRPSEGAILEAIQIEKSGLALDWIVGTTAPGCARVWVDGDSRLVVDVRR